MLCNAFNVHFSSSGEWGQLCSLDLICDSAKAYEQWTSAVSSNDPVLNSPNLIYRKYVNDV